MEPETVDATENNQLVIADVGADAQPNKRRKKKSIVWEHFYIENVGEGCRRACCKECKQSFAYSTGSKVAGTSHLKRHIAKGGCRNLLRQQENNQLSPFTPKTSSDTPKRRYRTAGSPNLMYNPDRCRHEIANMIIMHGYPLHMVEHSGFVNFVQNLQPRFDMVNFKTIQGDCVATYLREKHSIMKLIEEIPGHICLTLDFWTSSQTTGYVFMTGYYVDSDWKSHRQFLNVVMEPYPESDTAFSHAVEVCLSDWSLENKLFSLTISQPLSDAGIDSLRSQMSIKNPLILNGQLLIQCCLARTLSSMGKDLIVAGKGAINKIRDNVKYVQMSDSHVERFGELKQQLQVPSTKSLSLDNQTQWNTTYDMLLAASEMKEVFSCLDTSDPDYREALSEEDWKQVEILCSYLKLLYDTANMLTTPTGRTSNVYFHEVCKIQIELARAAASHDPFVAGLTKGVHVTFCEYWGNSSLILAVAVVMDPRYKMKLVEFSFSRIHMEDAGAYIKLVDEGIHDLFQEYVSLPLPLTPTYAEDRSTSNAKNEESPGGSNISANGLMDFDAYIMETTSQQSRSELDMYLEESLLPRVPDFDVSNWWKLNRFKYPTLSKMARDILSLSVCTVAPDSVFDTVSKEMDSYRSSLRPETLEAIICAKDWLQHGPSASSDMSNALVKVETLV